MLKVGSVICIDIKCEPAIIAVLIWDPAARDPESNRVCNVRRFHYGEWKHEKECTGTIRTLNDSAF
jgi:hypothetical protein